MNDELELGTEELEEEVQQEETPAPPPQVQANIDPEAFAKALRETLQQPAQVVDPIEALYARAAENWYTDPVEAQRLQRQAANLEAERRMQSYQQEVAETLRPLREEALVSAVAGDVDVEVKQKIKGFLQGMDSRALANLQNDPKVMQLLGYAAKGMQLERPARPKAPTSFAQSQAFDAQSVDKGELNRIMNWFGLSEKDALEVMKDANNG